VKKLFFKLAILLQGIILLGTFHSCKKDKCNDPTNPDCENYDPCYGKSPVKAEIKMGPIHRFMEVNGYENFMNEDTIFCAPANEVNSNFFRTMLQYIGFKCPTPGVKTTWKLGAEIINDSFFARFFEEDKGIMGKYQVSLIVEKEPDVKCFPFDDGKDTLVKTFEFVPNYELPIMGVYRVLFEGDTDSTTLEIRPWAFKEGSWGEKNFEIVSTKSTTCMALINFRNCQDTFAHFDLMCTYTGNRIQFGDFPESASPSAGKVNLNKNNIEGNYFAAHKIKNIPYKQYKFKGRKIQ
jgi:hypothetical protein